MAGDLRVDPAAGLDLDTVEGLNTFIARNQTFQLNSMPGGPNWSAAVTNIVMAKAKLARLAKANPDGK